MKKLYIGIDGGGTKTDVICTDAEKNILGHGSSGPTNLTSTTVGAASFNLKEAVRQSLETIPASEREVVAAAMGLAGLDTEREYEVAYKTFTDILKPFGITKFSLVNDSWIALANGTDNPNAIILISGTGSICWGRNAAGLTVKTGGMDYLLTDQGSGYDIGRHVLREAVKSYDGRRSKTILEELVCTHFGIRSIEHLKTEVYSPVLSKIEVAELAQLCSTAYEKGDPAAKEIFEWAQKELVLLSTTVLNKLGQEKVPTDIVLSGAILGLPHVKEGVTAQLTALFPQLHFMTPEQPPVYGALKMAMQTT
jgi:N-acetylglucosamine kinase-like BadF-type ATPase